jgi:hypothetical protein
MLPAIDVEMPVVVVVVMRNERSEDEKENGRRCMLKRARVLDAGA